MIWATSHDWSQAGIVGSGQRGSPCPNYVRSTLAWPMRSNRFGISCPYYCLNPSRKSVTRDVWPLVRSKRNQKERRLAGILRILSVLYKITVHVLGIKHYLRNEFRKEAEWYRAVGFSRKGPVYNTWISQHLRPEASATRKAALYERNLSSQLSIGSYGGRRKDSSKGRMSQSGNRLGARTSFREAPLITSLKRGSSEKERHPNC